MGTTCLNELYPSYMSYTLKSYWPGINLNVISYFWSTYDCQYNWLEGLEEDQWIIITILNIIWLEHMSHTQSIRLVPPTRTLDRTCTLKFNFLLLLFYLYLLTNDYVLSGIMPPKYASSSKQVLKKGNKKAQYSSSAATESSIYIDDLYDYLKRGKVDPKS